MTAALGLLVLLMVLVAALRLWPRVRLWRAGAPAPVDWRAELLALPGRYLHDVHTVVARDPYAARMHAAVAGGLIAACALAALALLPPLGASRVFAGLAALAFLLMLAGTLAVGARRYPARPQRLSGGAFQVLPFLLLGLALGGTLAAGAQALALSPVLGWTGFALAVAGGLGLAWSVGAGPMRHAVAGATWLAAHPRPARFGHDRRDTALRPLDLDAERLGADVPADFTWNTLLSFDACIQCGRCEAACPAFAAGQPLNPKRLVQDLAAAMTPGGNPAYAGSPYPHARAVAGVSGLHAPVIGKDALVHPDTLWSCTTCRACVSECPMMIEHVDAIVDLRRFQTLERGAVPIHAEAALAELRGADEPGGNPLANRTDFAPDLPLMGERGGAELLLWLGTGAYDLRTGRTLRALVALLRAAKVDFAVLGEEERDCGDLARRLGDEATFQRLARLNIETLNRYRFMRILTADPHSLHTIRNEYPALGGRFEVVHHTAFLDELAATGRLALRPAGGEAVTFHDPCYLARYNGEVDAPRRLLDRLGLERREMARSGTRALCCGGGGGAPLSDVAGERRIPDIRMAQAAETGAALVAVACPQCAVMLEGVAGERPDVLDIAELTLRALEPAEPSRAAVPA
ncbi:DUF3483 domain-containing protein [Aureimonas jatrophae]|uniref:Fe-S oxidoreductase n=1 Tax=Aureimonas jatrophae TaxID=1166073 RepID=A0A1H0DCA0_9HYPH|nr:DUF3483 domain-containing protein [Aureimonas jatrophae]MBB3951805.1 Fe-S oxidoreductase [Aureimonas jatrophae]SDN67591.1 Fe-S oxidoreductase [Aureimonas jatrophae]